MAPEVGLTVPPGDSEPLGDADRAPERRGAAAARRGCTRARARALRLGQAGCAWRTSTGPWRSGRVRIGLGRTVFPPSPPGSSSMIKVLPVFSTRPEAIQRARHQGARAAPGDVRRGSASPGSIARCSTRCSTCSGSSRTTTSRSCSTRRPEPRDRRSDRPAAPDPRGGAARLGAGPGRHDDDHGGCARRLPPRHQGRPRRGGSPNLQQARSVAGGDEPARRGPRLRSQLRPHEARRAGSRRGGRSRRAHSPHGKHRRRRAARDRLPGGGRPRDSGAKSGRRPRHAPERDRSSQRHREE